MYWGDYVRDTGHLNAAGHGAYMMLIKHYWCTAKPLTNDDDELWRIACCDSRKEWLSLRPKIVRLFLVDGGLLRHKRIDTELERAVRLAKAKADAGKEGANKRWQRNGTPIADTTISDRQTDDSRDAITRASPSHSPSERKKERTPLPPKRERAAAGAGVDDQWFATFWAVYPRKSDKGHARKAWASAAKRAEPRDIVAGVHRYKFSHDPQYLPLAATWLNGDRWADELPSLGGERVAPSPSNPAGRPVLPMTGGL